MRINNVLPEKVAAYWYHAQPGVEEGRAAAPGERVILYLHGGGYVMGSAAKDSATASATFSILKACSSSNFSRTLAVEYRISGGLPLLETNCNPFPAALLDAISAYSYLLKLGFAPHDIVVYGESAGAHLAFDLVLYLCRSHIPELPIPGGLLMLSPTADWALTHNEIPGNSMERNRPSDFVHTILNCGYSARSLLGDLPADTLRTSAYLALGGLHLDEEEAKMFAKFPPTCVIAGEAEQTLDAMRTLRERLVDQGVHVRYHEYQDAFHVPVILGHIGEPWKSMACRDIARWIEEDLYRK
ncbi:alpha/beta-hydrolase [Exidia glandulosa HHB12029]|uniref:Alpha/beta-hydrolase n=1 Tax=Exidia glandulosa HHB12029 TaxID=1314781 RepID=A0A165G3D4_EXIGL|nr:alpha/beta-hydrolase [Exidia glandulosa HHB12029]